VANDVSNLAQNETLKLAPAIISIFGVTGDLSTRKLLPALYELEKNKLLHEKTRIVGITRRTLNIDDLLQKVRPSIRSIDGRIDEEALVRVTKKIIMYQMNSALPDDYPKYQMYMDNLEEKLGLCLNRLFYLAIPPQISMPIIRNLGKNGLNFGCTKHRNLAHLLLEKPFGFDLNSALELVETTKKYFKETQLFRIDHYLAKETVQNIVTFRFQNPIFEDIWDNNHVESIEIVADEKLDIEGRANFYENVGALRDLIQSHLLYVMAIILMPQPKDINSSKEMHKMRQLALDSIEPVPADCVNERAIRAQYEGYKAEVENKDSHTETFAALKLFSNDPVWRDVPIYLRSGKALDSKKTSVSINFKAKDDACKYTNQLTFHIQPNESIVVQFWVKKPGFEKTMQLAPMEFSYKQTFDSHGHPDAYERVLVDAIRGDNMLFATSDEVLAAWRILQFVVDAWGASGDGLKYYAKGSTGPNATTLYM